MKIMLSNESNDLSKFLTPTPIIISPFSKNRRIIVLGQTQLIHMFDVEDPMCVLKWIQGLVLLDKPGFKIRIFSLDLVWVWSNTRWEFTLGWCCSSIRNLSTSFQKPKPDYNLISWIFGNCDQGSSIFYLDGQGGGGLAKFLLY